MMKNQLLLAATLTLLASNLLLADDKEPAIYEESRPSNTEHENRKFDQVPGGPALKEVEEIRKQLGPEFSIESKELGIERDRREPQSADDEWRPTEDWPGTQLYQEVRELVGKFRHNARHLEELAAQAEQMSEYGLADQLREMARHQWEHARELSKPRSTRQYHNPWQATPPHAAPPVVATPHWAPPEYHPPTNNRPREPAPTYRAPSAPSQQFGVPSSSEPKTR
ncbi:hypothetical protein Pan97_34420 [Bremerella volcania]|uniref:Uncharacterized protein n=1 Tax=Bremerella volcania TaxID=2527984 RepID=A0A518CAY4_9BACT|nr:hypothetical protein [Bremerella volcania]QDU76393.1 hypothetical protein Pan97_34420 [Bremerella volcania]